MNGCCFGVVVFASTTDQLAGGARFHARQWKRRRGLAKTV